MSIQRESKLFKKYLNKAETSPKKQFFEEGVDTYTTTLSENIWLYDIPKIAPAPLTTTKNSFNNTENVNIVYADKVPMSYVSGSINTTAGVTSKSFINSNLKDVIPFTAGVLYMYKIFKADGNTQIPLGVGDWLLDTESGLLTFNEFSTANIGGGSTDAASINDKIYIQCYIYIGPKGSSSQVIRTWDLDVESKTVNVINFSLNGVGDSISYKFQFDDSKYSHAETPITINNIPFAKKNKSTGIYTQIPGGYVKKYDTLYCIYNKYATVVVTDGSTTTLTKGCFEIFESNSSIPVETPSKVIIKLLSVNDIDGTGEFGELLKNAIINYNSRGKGSLVVDDNAVIIANYVYNVDNDAILDSVTVSELERNEVEISVINDRINRIAKSVGVAEDLNFNVIIDGVNYNSVLKGLTILDNKIDNIDIPDITKLDYVKLNGSNTMAIGYTPTLQLNVATKKYVDDSLLIIDGGLI